MESGFLHKGRGLWILIAILVFSFLLLTYEVRFTAGQSSLPKRLIVAAAAPFLQAVHFLTSSVSDIWHHYLDLREVRQENQALRQELERMKREEIFLREAQRENERLHRLLRLRESLPPVSVVARVIGKDPGNWFRSILVDKGWRDGVKKNAAVLCPQGLVGRTIEVMPDWARVQLITDPNFAAGALLEQSRVGGLLVGEVGPYCRLRFLPQDSEIKIGDLVLTSGLGGLNPKGIPIGMVTAVYKKPNSLFQEAEVEPRVDLFRLEEVLILGANPRTEVHWPGD